MITQPQYKLAILNARLSVADDVLDSVTKEQAGCEVDWSGIGQQRLKISAAQSCIEANNLSSIAGTKMYYITVNIAGADYNHNLTGDGGVIVPSLPGSTVDTTNQTIDVNIDKGTPNPAQYEYNGTKPILEYHLKLKDATGALFDTNAEVQQVGNKFLIDAATDENGLIVDDYVLTLLI